MFCNNCGAQIADDSQFCPSCGQKVTPANTPTQKPTAAPASPSVPSQPPAKKKRRGCGCVAALFLIAFVFAIVYTLAVGIPSVSVEMTSDDWIAFDDQTWSDYTQLLQNHNNFMTALTNYSNGQMDAVTFYSVCQESEGVFQHNSTCYNYGKNQDQKDYLSPFKTVCLADQQAAKSLQKYLDSHETGDLADAKDQIARAKEALTTIATNRGTLLASKTDLTEEQIQQRVNESTAALE